MLLVNIMHITAPSSGIGKKCTCIVGTIYSIPQIGLLIQDYRRKKLSSEFIAKNSYLS
jgi:hypothetical protein